MGSILQLDIILLLHREENRWWSAEQIAQEIRVGPTTTALALEELASRNLLDVRIGSTLAYRFSPVEEGVRGVLAEIAADHYTAREIVAAGAAGHAARRFAEAFRLRKTDG
ncbi:MAG TPA: hypothetical protein VM364_22330 [Vicinamibacterales bacterium]|nr:hypothetical protein [Vicinamibacterales bacterium]